MAKPGKPTGKANWERVADRILIIAGGFIVVVLAVGAFVTYGGGGGAVRDVIGIAGLAAAVGLYLFPSLAAQQRRAPNVGSVVVINVLLGWTVVGWVVALAMAMRDPRQPGQP